MPIQHHGEMHLQHCVCATLIFLIWESSRATYTCTGVLSDQSVHQRGWKGKRSCPVSPPEAEARVWQMLEKNLANKQERQVLKLMCWSGTNGGEQTHCKEMERFI